LLGLFVFVLLGSVHLFLFVFELVFAWVCFICFVSFVNGSFVCV